MEWHVIPKDDEKEHTFTIGCWCKPDVEFCNEAENNIVSHQAYSEKHFLEGLRNLNNEI